MLEKLKGTIDKGINAVSAKSESLVETNKTKNIMSNAQKAMDARLAALGQKFYADWKSGSVELETYVSDIEQIMQIERDIEGCKLRLEEIKREEEARIMNGGAQPGVPPVGAQPAVCFCTNCGRQLPAGSRFCDGCGAQLG